MRIFDSYGALWLPKFESKVSKDEKRGRKPDPVMCHNFILDDLFKDYIRKKASVLHGRFNSSIWADKKLFTHKYLGNTVAFLINKYNVRSRIISMLRSAST